MLTDDAEQRRRRLIAIWMCISVIWTVFTIQYTYSILHKNESVESKSTQLLPWEETDWQVWQEAKNRNESVAQANIKPLLNEETLYEDYNLYEEEKAVMEETEVTETEVTEAEVTEIEVTEAEVLEVEKVEEEGSTNPALAKSITTMQNVVEGEKLGTFFIGRRPEIPHTDGDVILTAQEIEGEAGNCSIWERYGVGQVLINRLLDQSGRFPQEDLTGILYASGQFGCTKGRAFKRMPSEENLQIAKDLLEGAMVMPADIVWFSSKHDYGYLYCHNEYHYFSGYIDHSVELKSIPVQPVEGGEIAQVDEEVTETIETEVTEEMLVAEVVPSEASETVETEAEAEIPLEESEQVEENEYLLAMNYN